MGPAAAVADGVLLSVRLTPRASRDEIAGVVAGPDGPALQARVRAVPEKGRANKALVALVAKWIGAPKSDVSVAGGQKSRNKTLHVAGATAVLIDRVNCRIAELS